MIRIRYTDLIYFCKETLKKAGLDKESVEAVTKVCVKHLYEVSIHMELG